MSESRIEVHLPLRMMYEGDLMRTNVFELYMNFKVPYTGYSNSEVFYYYDNVSMSICNDDDEAVLRSFLICFDLYEKRLEKLNTLLNETY